ncbi:hypothetical protein JZ785_20125 [Alicyclobacillus curvatus]|nr:hypothetical protein JZ785_20125 [Alicyclobacillus curvatus]
MNDFPTMESGKDEHEHRMAPKSPEAPSYEEAPDENASTAKTNITGEWVPTEMHHRAEDLVPASTSRTCNEAWIPQVVMWLPMYESGYGNASKVALEDGRSFIYKHSSAQTWADILRFYAVDKAEYRNLYREVTGRSQSVPIVVPSRGLVLVPAKIRVPRVKNDGAIGYIAERFIHHVNRVVEGHEYAGLRITLTTGAEALVQMSPKNFQEVLKNARYFMYQLSVHKVYP